MPQYRYKVRDADGKKRSGTTDGSSAVAVRNLLVAQHLDVIKVSERKRWTQIEITREKLKPAEVMNFSRQLGAFLRAGIPVLDALEALGEDASNAVLKRTIDDIADRLRGGSSFADAVGAHREIFPAYYVGILRSAELTGNLDIVLDQLAAYIERDLDTRRSVTSALTYPAVILAMAIVTVTVLAAYVLPKFEGFFDDFNADLPFATRLLLNISDFFQTFWPVLLVGGIVIVGGSWAYFRTERGKVSRDRLLLRTPVVGDVVRMSVIERFCRILATMLRAGVPITDSMAAASEATNNRVYQAALVGARDEMIKGEGIARPIEETGLFPGAASQMLKVGEQSGTLDQQLEIAADFYEVELKHKLARLTSLFEPAVIVVMGLIVGFVAIALVSAMYGLLDKVTVK
jgi:type IV pilus assembly protein PilC